MKKPFSYFVLTFLLISVKQINSQTIFWHETFGTGCNQGALANVSVPTATNGMWTVTGIGAQGAQANEWYISATEAGKTIGSCGDGCINTPSLTNRTLHIGVNFPNPSAEVNANYLANVNSLTNKRAESPTINCTNKGSIIFSARTFYVEWRIDNIL